MLREIPRRSKLEVFLSILQVAEDEAKKTEIVYKSNLTFTRTTRYLQFLEARGLIRKTGKYWKTTERGREFINDFKKLRNHIQPAPKQVEKLIEIAPKQV